MTLVLVSNQIINKLIMKNNNYIVVTQSQNPCIVGKRGVVVLARGFSCCTEEISGVGLLCAGRVFFILDGGFLVLTESLS